MPPGTGRMIIHGIGREKLVGFLGMGFGAELFYSFILIVCSLMIYFGTRELYELSSHKGIKYFRYSFLFFAIAFFFRSFIKFVIIYFGAEDILEFPIIFGLAGLLTQFLFVYFSSMAVFYLLYSVMWKKWNNKSHKIYLFHGLAFFIALVSILSGNPWVYLELNLLLLLVVIFVVYTSYQHKNKKKGYNLYFIYFLLSVFWILNIIDTLIPKFFEGFQLFIYLASSGVFLTILYKVLKKAGGS